MTKQLLIIFFVGLTMTGYSQVKNEKLSAVGISIPIIWNNTEGTYYSLGNRKTPTGNDISYGINANFTKSVYKNWYVFIGTGYFNQSFKIIRPFDFDGDVATNLLYSTKSYQYHSIKLEGGFGYKHKISQSLSLNFLATYNFLKSFKQKYVPTRLSGGEFKSFQINNKNMQIGKMLNLSIGVEKKLNKKISFGADLLFPIVAKWNNDETFTKYLYTDDSQQIGRNKFSIGTNISCKYHF